MQDRAESLNFEATSNKGNQNFCLKHVLNVKIIAIMGATFAVGKINPDGSDELVEITDLSSVREVNTL